MDVKTWPDWNPSFFSLEIVLLHYIFNYLGVYELARALSNEANQ